MCARFYFKREDATAIIADMEACVSGTSYQTARREGVSEQDCAMIGSAFVYPGFRLPLGDVY